MLSKLQEKIQSVRGERELNFGNEIIEILVLPALPEMETNCGNGIAENGRKKKNLWQLSCRKWRKKKRRYVRNIFHNNLQVVSYYWFKFESNNKITFLPQ